MQTADEGGKNYEWLVTCRLYYNPILYIHIPDMLSVNILPLKIEQNQ